MALGDNQINQCQPGKLALGDIPILWGKRMACCMGLPMVVLAMQSGASLAESARVEVRGRAFANAILGSTAAHANASLKAPGVAAEYSI